MFYCFLVFLLCCRKNFIVFGYESFARYPPITFFSRGGAKQTQHGDVAQQDSYTTLAKAIRSKLKDEGSGDTPDVERIVKAFKTLSSAQKAFKGLDGAAHEAYQRTHSAEDVDIAVTGRARRSALRAGATAVALEACELCELVESPEHFNLTSPDGILCNDREIMLNATVNIPESDTNISFLVIYEPCYAGGAGVDHGGLDDTSSKEFSRVYEGRLIVILADSSRSHLGRIIKVLDQKPTHVRVSQGSIDSEIASVQPSLYKTAALVIEQAEHLLRKFNNSAIHFVGRSLAGGVATIAATIIDGKLPMPSIKCKKKRKQANRKVQDCTGNETQSINASLVMVPLQGIGKGRTSAVTLGAPPCISANVEADFITSIMYGDDIVCRLWKNSIDRFVERTRRALKSGGFISRQMNLMTDTLTLAASNLQSHAHGSEGEEARLSVPGHAYLVRPRKLGHACSMHEVGAYLKGGRDALRAAVLWQLNDILLSSSMWKHHDLLSYIHGLDRIHLRGALDEQE